MIAKCEEFNEMPSQDPTTKPTMKSDENKLKASAKMFHNYDASVVVNL